MKKLAIGFTLLLGLFFASSLRAQTYGDAVAAKEAAEAAYADASDGYAAVSALVANISALLDGLTEEEIGEELWDALDSAWDAIEDADSLYGEGDYWASYGMASWNNYDPEADPEVQLGILADIITNFSNACDCYTDAAEDYEDLEDECGDIYTDSLIKARDIALAKMTAARAAMITAKNAAAAAKTAMTASGDAAFDEWYNASIYTPGVQATYDEDMRAGNGAYSAGNGRSADGELCRTAADLTGDGIMGVFNGAYYFETLAKNVMEDNGNRRQAADTAASYFAVMTSGYNAAAGYYNAGATNYDTAATNYVNAQTR